MSKKSNYNANKQGKDPTIPAADPKDGKPGPDRHRSQKDGSKVRR